MDWAIEEAWLFQSLTLSSKMGHWLAMIPSTVSPSELDSSAAASDPKKRPLVQKDEIFKGLTENKTDPLNFVRKEWYPEAWIEFIKCELQKWWDWDLKLGFWKWSEKDDGSNLLNDLLRMRDDMILLLINWLFLFVYCLGLSFELILCRV